MSVRKGLTGEDINGYLKVKDEYTEDDVLVELAYGDFKTLPLHFLEYLLRTIVDEDRNAILNGNRDCGIQKAGGNNTLALGVNVPFYTVNDITEVVGDGDLNKRIDKLLKEAVLKTGVESASIMMDDNWATCRRVAVSVLGNVYSILHRFKPNSEDVLRGIEEYKSLFKEAYLEEMNRLETTIPIEDKIESKIADTKKENYSRNRELFRFLEIDYYK